MNGELEKQQVVLLLDTERPGTGSAEHQYRAQCVACTRLLLGLGGFPNREHPTNLQWSYKLFSSRTPAKLLKRGTAHFQKLHSEVLAEFFKDYKLSLNSQATKPPPVPGKDVWARHVYSVLAAAVQDFVWDAPEIKTPVHPRPRQRKSRRKQKTNAHAPPSSPHGNMIFLFSEGPGDCGGGGGCGSQVPLAAQVLPQAMMEQLRLKKISVFWVQSSLGAVVKNMCEDFRGLDSMLRSTGGGVVSISTFLDPVCGVSSSAAEHTGLDQGEKQITQDNGSDVPQGVPGPHTPSLPTSMSAGEGSTGEREHVPVSVVAPSMLLKEVLRGGRGVGVSRDRQQLKEAMLFWLCAKDGKAMCVLELGEILKPPQNTNIGGFSSPPLTRNPRLTPSQPAGLCALKSHDPECNTAQDNKHEKIILILGAVGMSDVSFQWLDFSCSYFCSSYFTPTQVSVSKLPLKHKRAMRSPSPDLMPATMLSLHKSPQIHLYRSPVSSCRRVGSKVGRRRPTKRRSTSVPDLNRRAGNRRRGQLEGMTRQVMEGVARRGVSSRCSSASPRKGVGVLQPSSPSSSNQEFSFIRRKEYPAGICPEECPVEVRPNPAQACPSAAEACPEECPVEVRPDPAQACPSAAEACPEESPEGCPDPCKYLEDSCEYSHSKEYQNLSVWLASKRLLLLVKVLASSRLAVLQPTSSLVSTLTCVKPGYHSYLESLAEPLPHHVSSCADSAHCGEEREELRRPVTMVSPLELRGNIQLLATSLEHSSSGVSGISDPPSSWGCCVQPFTYTPLMPWAPYAESCGVKSSTLERVRELQAEMANTERGKLERRRQLILQLKEAYTKPSSGYTSSVPAEVAECGPLEREEGGGREGSPPPGPSSPGPVLGVEELFGQFKSACEQRLSAPDMEVLSNSAHEMLALTRWMSEALPRLLQEVTSAPDGSVEQFWELLESDMLSSRKDLDVQYSGGSMRRGLIGCLFQVLLELECWKLRTVKTVPASALGRQLIRLLIRASSLVRDEDSILLYNFFDSVLQPLYGASCPEVLDVVRQFWMSAGDSDEGSEEGEGEDGRGEGLSAEEGGSMEELSEPMSLERPQAPRIVLRPNAKKLMRHMSFQEPSTRRLIAVPSKYRRKKRKMSLADEEVPLKAKSSPGKARSKTEGMARTRRKSVCRSLFSRSHTVGDMDKQSGHLGRRHKGLRGFDPGVLVKETPVKLQTLKPLLVPSSSPGVKTVEESPRRSFYASKGVSRAKLFQAPQFKTPPQAPHPAITKIPTLPLKKNPSPSTILSLIQAFSPYDATPPSATEATPTTTTTTVASTSSLIATQVSPDLFSTPADILSSEDLFPGLDRDTPPALQAIKKTPHGPGRRSARMLTYEGEEPFAGPSGAVMESGGEDFSGVVISPDREGRTASVSVQGTPKRIVRTPVKSLRTPVKSLRTPVKSPSRIPVKSTRTPVKSPIRTLLKSPVRTPVKSIRTMLKSSSFRTSPANNQVRLSPVKAFLKHATKSGRSPPTKFTRTPTKLTTSYKSPETLARVKKSSNKKQCDPLPHSSSFDLGGVKLISSYGTPVKPIEPVALVTPPSHAGSLGYGDTEGGSPPIAAASGMDPVLMEDSASQVAFSLSTPTKDTPTDFQNIFSR